MTTNLPTIRRNGFFSAVLANVDTLEGICGEYLMEDAPNIAGLCARLGTTPQTLRTLFTKPETDLDAPPSESMHLLANTIMHIEDGIVSRGLTGKFNAHMAKFILSAFHERHEKHLQQNQTDQNITVTVQSHQPIDLAELREMDRLETALAEQEHIELAAMGKLIPPEEPGDSLVGIDALELSTEPMV